MDTRKCRVWYKCMAVYICHRCTVDPIPELKAMAKRDPNRKCLEEKTFQNQVNLRLWN